MKIFGIQILINDKVKNNENKINENVLASVILSKYKYLKLNVYIYNINGLNIAS